MKYTLGQTVNTFFNSNRTTISSLIREMKLDKVNFDNLMNKMTSQNGFGDFRSRVIKIGSTLNKEIIVDLFRDSSLRMRQLFNGINTNGLVLNSFVDIFSAEIDKLQKDIENLELFINNYEFLSGKDDLFTMSYLENFSSSKYNYKFDNYEFAIPDRDSSKFPMNDGFFIDSQRGVLKIGKEFLVKNVIKNIENIKISNNYQNYITNESDFKNLFNDSLTDSWSLTIKSPLILSSSLSEYDKYITYDSETTKGARTAVEVEFHSPILMDTIRFSVNFGDGLNLMQVVIFDELKQNQDLINDNSLNKQWTTLLNKQYSLGSNKEIFFEKTTVKKIIFIFNQSAYFKNKSIGLASELNSKSVDAFVKRRMEERRTEFSKIQDISYWFFKRNYFIEEFKKNRMVDSEFYSFKFPETLNSYLKIIENELFKASKYAIEDNPVFTNSPIFIDLISTVISSMKIDKNIFANSYFIENRSVNNNSNIFAYPGFIALKNSDFFNNTRNQYYLDSNGSGTAADAIRRLFVQENKDAYEYTFSLKSIEFLETKSEQLEKSVYVSRKIPTNGQILAAKAKLDTVLEDITSISNDYDLPYPGSYELSISNVEYPINEDDWIPIAPNDVRHIDSEVVFFDSTTLLASLRFIPKSDSIILYKNGILIDQVDSNGYSNYVYNSLDKKLKLNNNSLFSNSDIFVASYTLETSETNPFEVNFIKRNIFKEAIVDYKNRSGSGQIFQRTSSNSSITLDFNPYINQTYANSASYDPFFGTMFSDSQTGYSPVKIKLADGSFATNITNYSKSIRDVKFFSSTSVQFIQNGKNVLFNTDINAPFTVYYQYIPYSLRFRLILRKNIPFLDIPIKADSVLIKLKTENFDPYYDKLNYISKN